MLTSTDDDNKNKNLNNSTDDDLQNHLFLVDVAINQIKARCKAIKLNDSTEDILNMVCASLVNLWISSANAVTEPTGSIKANGYSLSKNSKEQIALAKKLFDHWRCCAAHLLVDEGFAFFTQKELIAP